MSWLLLFLGCWFTSNICVHEVGWVLMERWALQTHSPVGGVREAQPCLLQEGLCLQAPGKLGVG